MVDERGEGCLLTDNSKVDATIIYSGDIFAQRCDDFETEETSSKKCHTHIAGP